MYTHILQILLEPAFWNRKLLFFGNVYGASRKKKNKTKKKYSDVKEEKSFQFESSLSEHNKT